jgi:hypothetical protein
MPELHLAEGRCELIRWAFEGSTYRLVFSSLLVHNSWTKPTNKWANEDTHVAGESKEAKSSCLSMLGAVLGHHGSDSDYRASKDTTQTSEQHHLPKRLTHSKESRSCSQA